MLAFGEACDFHFCQSTYLLTVPISATEKFDKSAFYIFIQVIDLKDVACEWAEGRAIGGTNVVF